MIRARDLHKTYLTDTVRTHALNGVSFEMGEGEFVSIMGPSGSGKSTLLNVVGLIDNLEGGQLEVLGQKTTGLPEGRLAEIRKKNIGFVFQSFNLIDELSVAENVGLALRYQGVGSQERRDRVDEVLERFEIAHRATHFPQQLSGGQQQRVAIARAVVSRPRIILADEPTGNLDSENGAEVMSVLSELNANGTAVLMVTHSQECADRAQRILHMVDGKLMEEAA